MLRLRISEQMTSWGGSCRDDAQQVAVLKKSCEARINGNTEPSNVSPRGGRSSLHLPRVDADLFQDPYIHSPTPRTSPCSTFLAESHVYATLQHPEFVRQSEMLQDQRHALLPLCTSHLISNSIPFQEEHFMYLPYRF
jgi:hypothetical protein